MRRPDVDHHVNVKPRVEEGGQEPRSEVWLRVNLREENFEGKLTSYSWHFCLNYLAASTDFLCKSVVNLVFPSRLVTPSLHLVSF